LQQSQTARLKNSMKMRMKIIQAIKKPFQDAYLYMEVIDADLNGSVNKDSYNDEDLNAPCEVCKFTDILQSTVRHA
jgi:hypothetical protein